MRRFFVYTGLKNFPANFEREGYLDDVAKWLTGTARAVFSLLFRLLAFQARYVLDSAELSTAGVAEFYHSSLVSVMVLF